MKARLTSAAATLIETFVMGVRGILGRESVKLAPAPAYSANRRRANGH